MSNSKDKKLRAPIQGIPCQHHSQVVCTRSRAYKFLVLNHVPLRPACRTQNILRPTSSPSQEYLQDTLEFHLQDDKPVKYQGCAESIKSSEIITCNFSVKFRRQCCISGEFSLGNVFCSSFCSGW
ncbi:hypothetical protein TorRG33x02_319770 [Trema orientale]|uniref:Uncharacterized protein n=1 Tax=Trema orientale TaxID=63057 RepID=A0A2P5BIG1_TREOI|nr:hypothetical protein TorRG33x02_319770 [Trema orientale]